MNDSLQKYEFQAYELLNIASKMLDLVARIRVLDTAKENKPQSYSDILFNDLIKLDRTVTIWR